MLFVLQYGGSIGYAIIIITFILLYIGMCFYIDDMVKDLRIEVQKIDQNLIFPTKKRLRRNENLLQFIEEFQFHKDIFE